jgi:hypothetical protein
VHREPRSRSTGSTGAPTAASSRRARGHQIYVYDAATARRTTRCRARRPVTAVAWSPDGSHPRLDGGRPAPQPGAHERRAGPDMNVRLCGAASSGRWKMGRVPAARGRCRGSAPRAGDPRPGSMRTTWDR